MSHWLLKAPRCLFFSAAFTSVKTTTRPCTENATTPTDTDTTTKVCGHVTRGSLTHSLIHSLSHSPSLPLPPPVEVTVRGKVSIYKQASANWRVEGGQLTDQLFALWISWCFLHAVLLHPGVTLYYSLLHCSLFYIFNDSIVLRTGNWFFFMSFFLPHLFTCTISTCFHLFLMYFTK